ncbi:unnamed protein product [Symbiodinium natans]|uniref:Pentatricopeptide repeat-containing protein, chloroplastic n=1 Tax=Symbiodinium natans TaxID=878477 RepID=A0A812SL02_9DINO|nr:unnamed protein product [Symbiodinium natans]
MRGFRVSVSWDSSDAHRAISVLEEVERRSLELNVIPCNAVLSALAKCSQWLRAVQALWKMQAKRIQPDDFSFGAAITALEKAGCWQHAIGMWMQIEANQVRPNLIHCNSAISACEKAGAWEAAYDMLVMLQSIALRADAITCSAVISACEKGDCWEQSLDLLAWMGRTHLEADVICCNGVISACEKGGRWEQALLILRSVTASALRPTRNTFNAAIRACGRDGQWQNALLLLGEMEHVVLTPDVVTYGAAICSCDREESWEVAMALLSQAQVRVSEWETLDGPTWHYFAQNLCENLADDCEVPVRLEGIDRHTCPTPLWDALLNLQTDLPGEPALLILENMEALGVPRGQISFNTCMHALEEQWACSLQLLARLRRDPRVGPDQTTYTLFFKALVLREQWEEALQALDDMKDDSVPPTAFRRARRATSAAAEDALQMQPDPCCEAF